MFLSWLHYEKKSTDEKGGRRGAAAAGDEKTVTCSILKMVDV